VTTDPAQCLRRSNLNKLASRQARPEAAVASRPAGLLLLMALAVVALDILAVMLVPPVPGGGKPRDACGFPSCFIQSAIEFPPPAIVIDLAPNPNAPPPGMIYFHPSISSTILTMWIVMAFVLLLAFVATRRMKVVPGRLQNAVEWAYEFGSDFAVGIGGEKARRLLPIFAGFFSSSCLELERSGCRPSARSSQLRAPTSDVNVTIGLALTSFVIFQSEGFGGSACVPISASSSRSGSSATVEPACWPCTSDHRALPRVVEALTPMDSSATSTAGEWPWPSITRADSGGRPRWRSSASRRAEPDPGPPSLGPDPHVHPDRYPRVTARRSTQPVSSRRLSRKDPSSEGADNPMPEAA